MRIVIETIPYEAQRYDTCGDWIIEPDGTRRILVSELGVHAMEFLVAMHELVEMTLHLHRGGTQQQVDAFDMAFKPGPRIEEPGDDRRAPYYHEHQFAMGIERLLAAELGVDWNEYERAIEQAALTGSATVAKQVREIAQPT